MLEGFAFKCCAASSLGFDTIRVKVYSGGRCCPDNYRGDRVAPLLTTPPSLLDDVMGKQTTTTFNEDGKNYRMTGTISNKVTVTSIQGNLPHVTVRVSGMSDEWRLTLRATDERGQESFAEETASGHEGDERYLFLSVAPEAKTLELNFNLQRCRIAEFMVKPPSFAATEPAGQKPAANPSPRGSGAP